MDFRDAKVLMDIFDILEEYLDDIIPDWQHLGATRDRNGTWYFGISNGLAEYDVSKRGWVVFYPGPGSNLINEFFLTESRAREWIYEMQILGDIYPVKYS